MTVKAELLAKFSARQKGANDYGGPDFAPLVEFLAQFESGTGANQADVLFVDERTINASSNDDIDLAGALSDAFGATIAAAELVAVLVINKPKDPAADANLSDLTIGAAASNPFIGFLGGTAPTIGPLKPGAMLFLAGPGAAGLGTIGAGSADVLRIANGPGGAAKVQVAVLARTA